MVRHVPAKRWAHLFRIDGFDREPVTQLSLSALKIAIPDKRDDDL
jgi:hypothetical protein